MATENTPIKEALLHPLTLRRMKQIKAGRAISGLSSNKPLQISPGPSKNIIDSVTKFYQTGDMDILYQLLRANPLHIHLPPIKHQLWWLNFLHNFIEDNRESYHLNPDFDFIPTREFLWFRNGDRKMKSPWKIFTVGTRDAAHQSLVNFAQAWVQGLLPGYSIKKDLGLTKTKKKSQKPGRKETRSSYKVYGDPGGRVMLFYDMLETLEAYKITSKEPSEAKFTKEDFNKGSKEATAAFEARTIKLVQRVHQEFGVGSRYTTGGWLGGPSPKVRPLPKATAKTIAQQAMQKRTVNKKFLLCGLLSVYEDRKKGSPKNFKAISDSIGREEAEFPEFVPPKIDPAIEYLKTLR